MSRREAMRRLALLGVGTAAATALIAACGENKQERRHIVGDAIARHRRHRRRRRGRTTARHGRCAAHHTGDLARTARRTAGRLGPGWSPRAPVAEILVIHENKGLNDWIRSVAGRLAGAGYSSLAIDLLSDQGGTATFADPGRGDGGAGQSRPAGHGRRPEVGHRRGAASYTRGEGGRRRVLYGRRPGVATARRRRTPELAAAFPFYGPTPDDPDFSGSKDVAVLGFYGALDQRVNATEPVAKAALEKAGWFTSSSPSRAPTTPSSTTPAIGTTRRRRRRVARMQDWLITHVG